MDSVIIPDGGQLFSLIQINSESAEDTVLLSQTTSSTLHRRSVERNDRENNGHRAATPPEFSLEEITARRRGKRVEDEKLPKKVRSFYKKQDKLISTFVRAHRLHSDKHSDDEEDDEDDEGGEDNKNKDVKEDPMQRRKRNSRYTKLSLIINIGLFIVKIFAAYWSHSLSVISSVIDSGVDLTSSIILFWATRAIKRRDPFMYPQGRTRLEPISIVILSVIMCSASVMVITESFETIVKDSNALRNISSDPPKEIHQINMSVFPVTIMCSTIILKLILFLLCRRGNTVTLNALAQDHRNDVFSNIVALACGALASHAMKPVPKPIPTCFVLADPVGAVIISFYILITWIRQAIEQVKRLSGHTAKPEFLQQITWIAFHHSPKILKIDTVRAFHFGTHFLVEVDIVLPEDMSLKDAHDIGEALQKKIERIPEVERAFVHLDYEFSHKASDEHKIV